MQYIHYICNGQYEEINNWIHNTLTEKPKKYSSQEAYIRSLSVCIYI